MTKAPYVTPVSYLREIAAAAMALPSVVVADLFYVAY